MKKQDVEYLYEYNRWANARTLDAVSKLTPEQFTRDLRSSHRSVRDTFAHILAAEWIWLERWKGTSPGSLLNPSDFSTVESLGTRLAEVERDTAEFIDGLTDELLGTVISYRNTRGEEWAYPLGQMLQHVMNHSSYHRGQVTTLLRQLGADAIPVDLLVFMDVKAGQGS
ncbi:MAG: DinB family protein [Acidobacteriota bacterium]